MHVSPLLFSAWQLDNKVGLYFATPVLSNCFNAAVFPSWLNLSESKIYCACYVPSFFGGNFLSISPLFFISPRQSCLMLLFFGLFALPDNHINCNSWLNLNWIKDLLHLLCGTDLFFSVYLTLSLNMPTTNVIQHRIEYTLLGNNILHILRIVLWYRYTLCFPCIVNMCTPCMFCVYPVYTMYTLDSTYTGKGILCITCSVHSLPCSTLLYTGVYPVHKFYLEQPCCHSGCNSASS